MIKTERMKPVLFSHCPAVYVTSRHSVFVSPSVKGRSGAKD